MKVKKEAYLQSLTALLRPPTLKYSSDPNEQCEPWYITVPSITYIWTRRPQWRRRHKNRKKAKAQRFPLFINSGGNENDLWSTLKSLEKRCSWSSTSPYETCSSRQVVTESELMRNCGRQRNREVLTSNKKNHSFDRTESVCETRSDSGLRITRGTKLLRSIRSQKRLGVRNSANSQSTAGTLSSLEDNGSVKLSVWKGSQSDCSIPKRRVTFSNYVSENSVTDTRSQISSITMNDNDMSEASWCQRSYARLTDDEDNCSMQTNLSCLISSMIFESKSSFFSLTPDRSSDVEKKSKTTLNRKFSDSFFYVNSSYSNGSSCNLHSVSNNFSSDDFNETNGSFFIERNCNDHDDLMKKKLSKKPSLSSLSNEIIPLIKIPEKIETEATYSHDPRTIDFRKNQLKENLSESKQTVPEIKILEEIKTEPTYSPTPLTVNVINNKFTEKLSESNKIIPDIKIHEDIETDSTHSRTPRIVHVINNKLREKLGESKIPDSTHGSIECITIELKDISFTVEAVSIKSRDESNQEGHYASLQKNHISTDTSDLIALNLIPSLDPITEFLKNDVNNGRSTVSEILNFLQQPAEPLDASFLLKEFTRVRGKTFGNYDAINAVGNIGRKKSKDNVKKIEDQIEMLRIDTETCGKYESVLIEMTNFDDDFESNEILEKRASLEIRDCLREPCESMIGNSNRSSKYSEHVESSMSNFHNEYSKCSAGKKCCVICGRSRMDNSRYIRPVCRVKGGTSSPRLENDPWINVMKKVIKRDNRQELIPQQASRKSKNEEASKASTDGSSKNSASNEIPTHIVKEPENILEKDEKEGEECLSLIITEAGDPSHSIPPVETNILPSRADQSTSCCPPELRSSTAFGFATFRGPRTQSAKTYFMRESMRTVEGTANRLLCVISESNSLMAVPPFLPKKPPDWFVRQMPTRRWSRR